MRIIAALAMAFGFLITATPSYAECHWGSRVICPGTDVSPYQTFFGPAAPDRSHWSQSPGGQSAVVSGRRPVSILLKLNPLWWFGNDNEQTVDQAPWYMPGAPEPVRWVAWQFRNPFQNFRSYVVGVQDQNYRVTGRAPVTVVQRNDLSPPENGWQWSVINTPIPLPFVSYSDNHVVWYAGWQPSGFFGFKFNLSGKGVQVW